MVIDDKELSEIMLRLALAEHVIEDFGRSLSKLTTTEDLKTFVKQQADLIQEQTCFIISYHQALQELNNDNKNISKTLN